MLPLVQDAVARDLQVTFLYARPGTAPSTRTVDPLGLVWKQSVWYLVARTARGLRTYRMSRMRNTTVLGTGFVRPDFDLAAYWQAANAAMKDQRESYEVKLVVSPEALASLKTWLPVMQDDSVFVKVRFESRSQAKFVCLGLGCEAEVIEPADLQAAIVAEASQIARRLRNRD